MKLAVAMAASLLLVSGPCLADPVPGALPAGMPAGVQQAQMPGNTTLYVVSGVALIGVGIGLAARGGSSVVSNTTTVPPGTAP
jgi:hypothetical protein